MFLLFAFIIIINIIPCAEFPTVSCKFEINKFTVKIRYVNLYTYIQNDGVGFLHATESFKRY